MRKLLAAIIVFIMTTPAFAQQNHHRRGHHGHHGHHYNHQHRHHHQQQNYYYYQKRNNNVAPWVLGGLALGALGAYAITNPAPLGFTACWQEVIGYDRYGRPVYDQVCQ